MVSLAWPHVRPVGPGRTRGEANEVVDLAVATTHREVNVAVPCTCGQGVGLASGRVLGPGKGLAVALLATARVLDLETGWAL